MDKRKHENPSVAADIIIFTVNDDDLKVLLVKRKYEPFKESWAIPGGFVDVNESLEGAAKRELEEETGVRDVYLEQLYTFGEPKRDPRGRIISVSYFALINSKKVKLKASGDAKEVSWHSMYNLPKLSFDHKEILDYALKRLRWKLEYTTVVFSMLPKEFTLTELQNVYEIVFNKNLDKRNFRKKIFSLGLVKDAGKMTKDVSHRPAKLYKCNKKIGEIIEIF